MPAMRSSAMMPQPPGSDSNCRAGYGLKTSMMRKRTKPATAVGRGEGQEQERRPHPDHLVHDHDARVFQADAAGHAGVEATTPTKKRMTTAATWMAAGWECSGQKRRRPTAEPAVPGANGE